MELPSWLAFVIAILPHVARAVIEGSRAAGVTHDTVAKTVAKVILNLTNGVQEPAASPTPPA
jgi:hypothetical protein